jgi:hypothetical protein
MASPGDDWRLTNQEQYLRGVTLYRRRYTSHRPGWDHDHCSFCWAKFSESLPDAFREGWTTSDGYYWICDQCFQDFRDRFEWTLG